MEWFVVCIVAVFCILYCSKNFVFANWMTQEVDYQLLLAIVFCGFQNCPHLKLSSVLMLELDFFFIMTNHVQGIQIWFINVKLSRQYTNLSTQANLFTPSRYSDISRIYPKSEVVNASKDCPSIKWLQMWAFLFPVALPTLKLFDQLLSQKNWFSLYLIKSCESVVWNSLVFW